MLFILETQYYCDVSRHSSSEALLSLLISLLISLK